MDNPACIWYYNTYLEGPDGSHSYGDLKHPESGDKKLFLSPDPAFSDIYIKEGLWCKSRLPAFTS